MFSTDNTFYLVLPTNETIVFGTDKSDPNWVGLVGPNGVTSSVDIRESRSNISRLDGEIIGSSYYGNRSIVADIFINDTNPETRSNKLTKIQRANYLLRSPGLLKWNEKDSNNTAKQIPVRLQSFPSISHGEGPTKSVQLAFNALQPYIESQDEIIEIFTPEEEDNIFNFTLTNQGDWITFPVIKIRTGETSPEGIVDLIITNFTNGKELILNDIEFEQNMELIIDCNPVKKTITKIVGETETNIYNLLNLYSRFHSIESGENEFQITIGSLDFDTDELEWEFSYRYAWV